MKDSTLLVSHACFCMFCNHVAYNLAKAERRKLLFAVTEKIDNMAKKEIDNQRDTDYNEFISGV